ncbi:MAG: ABC transporter substrate-binding protein [Betaproteobacteria bacterium]
MTDPLAHEFAPGGTLRVGLNFGNTVVVQKDPGGDAPRGVGPDLARELARRLGLPVAYVAYETAGAMADAVKQGAWDIAFLARDPARAGEIDFSAPYMLIEGTYVVRRDSPFLSVGDIDRAGVRVAVGEKSAYDLFLSRNLKQATLVKFPSGGVAMERFRSDGLDAVAGVRQPLAAFAKGDASLRLLEGSFMAIGQASGVPRGRAAAADYLRRFIEEAKASGFVANALAASGQNATVAPPEAGSPR